MADTKTVSCPHCQSHVRDDGNYEGQVVACPFCDQQFQMPTAEMHAQAFADEFSTPQRQNAATTETLAYVGSERAAKPWQLTTVGALRMGSGVLNVLTGLSLFIFVVPLLLIPLGVFEIISGANLLSVRPTFSTSIRTLAIVEICAMLTCVGIIPMVVGILSLIWLAEPAVQRYFAASSPRETASTPIMPEASQGVAQA